MNQRELNTVLAALRLWQSGVHHRLELENIASNDGESAPLNGNEIDTLCERLNTSDFTFEIVVEGGCVVEVNGLPPGVDYTITDLDMEGR